MKLRNLHIEDYKMFKNFDISFVDENDEALPIVVLAGVNGSGKTSLFEYIQENLTFLTIMNHSYIEYENDNGIIKNTTDRINMSDDDESYIQSIPRQMSREGTSFNFIYFPSGMDNIKRVSDEFIKSFYFYLKEKDYRPSEVKNHFDEYMQEVFNGLDLTFKYSHLDRDDNVWFTNNNGEQFEINDLSTGEKTLLSKVLYLYFQGYQDKVILIDEPELSLHPSWQNKVLKIYENFAIQNNCQIIIATHSPHIIGSAKAEYLRVLVKEDNKIKVVDNFSNTYGLKFGQILTEVMGVEHLRPVEVDEQLDKVKVMIVQNDFESDTFKKEWNKLEDILGADYLELKLLKVEIASRKKNVSSK